MKRISRRELLKAAPLGGLALLLNGPAALRRGGQVIVTDATQPGARTEIQTNAQAENGAAAIDPFADEGAQHRDEHDSLHKIRDFDRTYADDYQLDE